MIDARVVVRDLVGCVGQVELDRPSAASLEVDEKRTGPSREQVARMGFAVQELLGPAARRTRSNVPARKTRSASASSGVRSWSATSA